MTPHIHTNVPAIGDKVTVDGKTFTFAEFLHRIGTLKSKPESWKDLYFAEAHGLAGD